MHFKCETKNEKPAILALVGRLDSSAAPEFESKIEALLPTESSITLDLENLEYISSAGLRVILKAQKSLESKDGLRLKNVSESVKEVFDITGFSDFLTIE